MELVFPDERVVVKQPDLGVVVMLAADQECGTDRTSDRIGNLLPAYGSGGQQRNLPGGVEGDGTGVGLGHVLEESLGSVFQADRFVVPVLSDLIDVLEHLVEEAFLAVPCAHGSQETGVLCDIFGTSQDVILEPFGCLFDTSHAEMFLACHGVRIRISQLNIGFSGG